MMITLDGPGEPTLHSVDSFRRTESKLEACDAQVLRLPGSTEEASGLPAIHLKHAASALCRAGLPPHSLAGQPLLV